MYLENIMDPSDVKKLSSQEKIELAKEMREALLQKISVCGGHFGPNFGIVEATIALHTVFNSPYDKFVFDVSHQSYCHKMLTGRKDAYLNQDQYNEVTGYSCPQESEHDFFNVGHTSTSISLACGLAKARDLAGGKENIIAVIGDGAMGGGEALEGLNFTFELHSNLIIVLNDNQMSIAENHGGLYPHLKQLRETEGKAENNIFKAFGLEYHYVADGNNIDTLIDVFSEVKNVDHPTVVHICTKKGKGYELAEKNKEDWHFRPPFIIETGDFRNHMTGENYDQIVCEYLLNKMKNDSSVLTIVAAVPLSIGFDAEKRKEAGRQFVDVGIMEEHALTLAAGASRNGAKAIFATHSSFYQRAYDQIAQEICINQCPVTLLVRNASVYGMNDVTHLGIFDIPLLSNIPNLVYLAPTNKEEYMAMLDWSIEQKDHPVAIRIPRNGVHHADCPVESDYSSINTYKVNVVGQKIAVVALGDFYQLGEETCKKIEEKLNIKATLVNPRYITGLDIEVLSSLKKDHDLVITLEDGILDGGFGEKIARFYGTSDVKVMSFGLKKEFVDRYNVQELLKENHLTAEQIVEDIMKIKEVK